MKKQLFLFVFFPFLLLGCGADKSADNSDTANTETDTAPPSAAPAAKAQPKMWELSVFGDPANYTKVPQDVKITVYLDFIKNELTGEAGCNSYTAPFQLTNGGLAVADIVATKKACPPELMALENSYLELLKQITTYEQTPELLTLNTADGKRLIFTYWVTE